VRKGEFCEIQARDPGFGNIRDIVGTRDPTQFTPVALCDLGDVLPLFALPTIGRHDASPAAACSFDVMVTGVMGSERSVT
jgi:hypothetical protein